MENTQPNFAQGYSPPGKPKPPDLWASLLQAGLHSTQWIFDSSESLPHAAARQLHGVDFEPQDSRMPWPVDQSPTQPTEYTCHLLRVKLFAPLSHIAMHFQLSLAPFGALIGAALRCIWHLLGTLLPHWANTIPHWAQDVGMARIYHMASLESCRHIVKVNLTLVCMAQPRAGTRVSHV